MTPITHYFLTRLDAQTVQVDIYDATSYASRQVYADNGLVAETTSTSFRAPINKNQKVDVLGLSSGEAGFDFSDQLSNTGGDKVDVELPLAYSGALIDVYYDHATGVLDFGRPLIDKASTDLSTLDGLGDLTLDELGELTLDGLGDLDLNTSGTVHLGVTKRLGSGDYKFALVNANAADNYHSPFIFSLSITTRPDETEPYLVSYDATLDLLTVSAGVQSASGTYSVYAAPWGGGKDAIDLTTPVMTSTSNPLVVSGFRGGHTSGSRYLCIRKSESSVEEKNFNALSFAVSNGEWTGNYPAAPTHLSGQILAANKVELTWEFQTGDTSIPDGFRVYSGTTNVDYSTPVATVAYFGGGIFSATLPAITQATKFSVRAVSGGHEEANVEYTTVTPLTVPTLITGTGTATWKDE